VQKGAPWGPSGAPKDQTSLGGGPVPHIGQSDSGICGPVGLLYINFCCQSGGPWRPGALVHCTTCTTDSYATVTALILKFIVE
jgi:hypothetical protein